MSFGTRKDRLPIVIINTYILISLFLYFFGPIRFNGDYSILMLLYMFIFLVAINVTYFCALHNCKSKIKASESEIEMSNRPLPFWFRVVGYGLPVLMIITSITITGFSGLSSGLAQTMAQTYTFVQSGGRYQEGIDIPMWLYMHLGVFVYLSIVDGIVHFKQLRFGGKLIFIGTIISLLSYFIFFKGTQKTLGDVFVLTVSGLLIAMYLKNTRRKKINKWFIVLIVTAVFVFAIILATIMGERISYLGGIGYDAFKLHTSFYEVNTDSPLLWIFPESTKIGFCSLIFYLCNGLYGLSVSLGTPFTWSYGIGSMMDLTNIIESRTGIDFITKSTYMYKAYELHGWHYSEKWHTIFPWLASDYTFIGAIAILCIATYIYAICWQEIIQGKNKESIYLFSILNIMWIYLPANNQIFSSRTTALIFIICFYMWKRRKRDVKKRWFFYGKERKNILHIAVSAQRKEI